MIFIFLLFTAVCYCLLQAIYFPSFDPFKKFNNQPWRDWKKFLIIKTPRRKFLWWKQKKWYQEIIPFSGVKISLNDFFLIKENILFIFGIFWILFLWIGDKSSQKILLLTGYTLFFFFLPDLILQIKRERREKKFAEQVPYFIDLFILSVQSGMNIEQSFIETAVKQKSLLAKEVKQQFTQLEYGSSTAEILDQLTKKIENEEWKSFLRSVVQAKKLGTSLAKILDLQVHLIRLRRRQKAEEFARTASVKIVLPLVLFIFPALLIIYIGPGLLHLIS